MMTRRFVHLVIASLVVFAVSTNVFGDLVCNHYNNVSTQYDQESQTSYCGAYGNGCTECYDDSTYASCVTDGASCCPGGGPFQQH